MWRVLLFLYVVVLVLAGCGDREPMPMEPTAAQDAVGLVPDSSPIRERLRLCEAWMVHAKVVGQDSVAGWVDIALEMKDVRTWAPPDQGGLCLDKISMWLVFPTQYLEFRGEVCPGPPITTDGQGPPCTEWRTDGYVEYDDLPFPRGRIAVGQRHGGGGVPMPPFAKRIIGTARLWRTGAEGTQKTHSYRGNVGMRYETMADPCSFAARSAWGHELTFGPPGTPVIVGPETQFCGIYPGCNRELTYCDRCPQ